MRKMAVYLTLLFSCFFCHAQNNVADPGKEYLFEKFADGVVLMKNGSVEKAPLNYNTADQSIVFLKEEKTLTLTGLETIDTIYFHNMRFVPGPDGRVYEVLTAGAVPASLFVTYTNRKKPAVAVTDQGGTTHKEAAEVSNIVSDVYMLRPYKGDFMVEIQKNYWLIKSKQVYKAGNLKQFARVFPHKDAAIQEYVSAHQVNFLLEGDLIQLTSFCNTLK
jgi:hypothetical protein